MIHASVTIKLRGGRVCEYMRKGVWLSMTYGMMQKVTCCDFFLRMVSQEETVLKVDLR